MPVNFDKALGDLPRNLTLYSQRSDVLASNIANADTPGYKARDIDFRSILAKAGGQAVAPAVTQAGHMSLDRTGGGAVETLYRVPLQPALDGNTVDAHVEQSEFTGNALRYQSTLTFLSGRFKSLMLAIKGE
jgi:flagellar basal-body rod protein FlgB